MCFLFFRNEAIGGLSLKVVLFWGWNVASV